MKGKALNYHITNGIAYLTLNNPPANPMNTVFFEELYDICHTCIAKEDYKGLIIRSAGRHFSSGADTDELLGVIGVERTRTVPVALTKNLAAFKILINLKTPSVSLIHGVCYGSGLELAMTARYRLATPKSLFALPEATFGLLPGLGGMHALNATAGLGRAVELVLSGRAFYADEARRLGIINDICIKDEIGDRAQEYLQRNS